MEYKLVITNLYCFIDKMLQLLEEELELISNKQDCNSLDIKKNITDIMNKLIFALVQINKLTKESDLIINTIDTDDQIIIEKYLEKYKS